MCYLYRSTRTSSAWHHGRDEPAANSRTKTTEVFVSCHPRINDILFSPYLRPPNLSSSPPAHLLFTSARRLLFSLPTHALRTLTDVRPSSLTLTVFFTDKTASNLVMRTTNAALWRQLHWHRNSKRSVCPQAQCLRRSPSAPPPAVTHI